MHSSSMKILMLTTDAFGGHGGIAQYNRDFITALSTHPAVGQVVVVPRNQPAPAGPIPPKVDFFSEAAGGKLAYATEAVKAAERAHYDLVICGHLNLLPIAWPARVLHGAPLMQLIYGIEAWRPSSNLLLRALANQAQSVVSISDITLQRFHDWAQPRGGHTAVLPNAIDLAKYGTGPKPPDLVEKYALAGRRVLLTLGRLDASERYKGFDEVLELMPAFDEDIVYVIAGDGTDRPRLEQKARSLGVERRVVFTGRVTEERKADTYRLADAFVMPGRGEGFGFVFLEAMACGIPVVASRLDGSREAVRMGKLGTLVDPDDKDETRAGILAALGRGRGMVPPGLEHFSNANFERRCHAIIDELTGAGQPAESRRVA